MGIEVVTSTIDTTPTEADIRISADTQIDIEVLGLEVEESGYLSQTLKIVTQGMTTIKATNQSRLETNKSYCCKCKILMIQFTQPNHNFIMKLQILD